jgi:hypothetical protein
LFYLAPRAGFEPATNRLTARCIVPGVSTGVERENYQNNINFQVDMAEGVSALSKADILRCG